MSVRCPVCESEYDITLFQFNKAVKCDCGCELYIRDNKLIKTTKKEEENKYRELQRNVDRICSMILMEECSTEEIKEEIESVRILCEKYFPAKLDLFEMIYEKRFKRLMYQYRNEDL